MYTASPPRPGLGAAEAGSLSSWGILVVYSLVQASSHNSMNVSKSQEWKLQGSSGPEVPMSKSGTVESIARGCGPGTA